MVEGTLGFKSFLKAFANANNLVQDLNMYLYHLYLNMFLVSPIPLF